MTGVRLWLGVVVVLMGLAHPGIEGSGSSLASGVPGARAQLRGRRAPVNGGAPLERAAELKKADPAAAAANFARNAQKILPTVVFPPGVRDVPVPPPWPLAGIKESIVAQHAEEKQRVERLNAKSGSATGLGAGMGGLGGMAGKVKSWKNSVGNRARRFAAARGDAPGVAHQWSA